MLYLQSLAHKEQEQCRINPSPPSGLFAVFLLVALDSTGLEFQIADLGGRQWTDDTMWVPLNLAELADGGFGKGWT